MTLSIEDMASFCKKKGIAYQSAELYGGLSGFFDFGPLGVELKNNIKNELWKEFVSNRSDIIGIDGSIITSPRVWEASGHVSEFTDPILICSKCKKQYKADDDSLKNSNCPQCKSALQKSDDVNLMFKTSVGASSTETYLRPETAQLIFANFKSIVQTQRVKLPFGIAQIGKAFRNEISPRDFLFRLREFEQFELEYFTHPKSKNECSQFENVADLKVNCLSASQQKDNCIHKQTTIGALNQDKVFSSKTQALFVGLFYKWFLDHGIKPENLRLREHLKSELAHYASACVDIEYKFPFGWKEIHGNADRSDYDLLAHSKHSKQDITVHIEEIKEKIIPHVAAEPSQGIERALLAFLFDAYDDDKERGNIVLHLKSSLAPIKVGVFPLVSKLKDKANEVFEALQCSFTCSFDKGGSIGRRYARADEQGIPHCVTIDFETLENGSVTVRNRDTTNQERVKLTELKSYLYKKIFDSGSNEML